MAIDINRYLGSALEPTSNFFGVNVVQHYMGDLLLPTGQLMACDPFMVSLCAPFKNQLPCGKFPFFLNVANNSCDHRNTVATLKFSESSVAAWTEMELDGPPRFWPDGIPDNRIAIDNALGCFFDYSIASFVAAKFEEFQGSLVPFDAKLGSNEPGCFIANFENANVIAFSSGYGDGMYGTYAAYDQEGKICAVVTDFVATP